MCHVCWLPLRRNKVYISIPSCTYIHTYIPQSINKNTSRAITWPQAAQWATVYFIDCDTYIHQFYFRQLAHIHNTHTKTHKKHRNHTNKSYIAVACESRLTTCSEPQRLKCLRGCVCECAACHAGDSGSLQIPRTYYFCCFSSCFFFLYTSVQVCIPLIQ